MIPKNFMIAGIPVAVELDSTLYKNRKIAGEARYPSQTIVLDPTIQAYESLCESYFHEKIHWLFYILGEHELRTNEKLVDTLAQLLYQTLTTSKEFYTKDEISAFCNKAIQEGP